MPFNLFPILWRLLLLKINELLNFHYFFRNFTCNSPQETDVQSYSCITLPMVTIECGAQTYCPSNMGTASWGFAPVESA